MRSRAAAAFTRALAEELWPEETPIRLRVAVYTGEAEQRDGDFYGTTVNRAARVRSLGFGGQVLLGEDTARAVWDRLPDGTALVDLGPRALKDLAEPERVFELRLIDANVPPEPLSDADASNALWAERLLASGFVNRVEARRDPRRGVVDGDVRRACARARRRRAGHGQDDARRGCRAARARRRRPRPVRTMGRGPPRIVPGAARSARARTRAACPRSILRADLRDNADEIARLLPEVVRRVRAGRARTDRRRSGVGATAPVRGDRRVARVDRLATSCLSRPGRSAVGRPSVDPSAHASHAVTVRAPILVIATFRREAMVDTDLEHFVPELTRESNVHRISLTGLASDDVLDLIRRFGGNDAAGSPALAESLQSETGGNPLFLREIVQHLSASDLLDTDDRSRIAVPESVRELVRWRLRPLPAGAKEAMAVASVIGLEFDVDLLAAARDVDPASVMDGLEAACRAGLLHEARRDGRALRVLARRRPPRAPGRFHRCAARGLPLAHRRRARASRPAGACIRARAPLLCSRHARAGRQGDRVRARRCRAGDGRARVRDGDPPPRARAGDPGGDASGRRGAAV